MKTIVTFGEIMGRLCPDGHKRFIQSMPGMLELTFAGAEDNEHPHGNRDEFLHGSNSFKCRQSQFPAHLDSPD